MNRITNCLSSIPLFSTGFLSVYLFLTFFSILPFCHSSCPYNVQKESHRCFEGYNTQLTALQKSHPDTLFSGVNIEVLRSFCSAYINSMKCIQRLKTDCPRQIATIDQALTNLEGAQEELSELCSDDKIYEVYAMHLTCFYNEGSYSERCFRTHMNTSKNLLSHLDEQPLEMLCRNLLKTLECIQSNIAQKCGSEAGDLVPKLYF
ncbi:hypothetical protein KUTeg_021242 [Tegillarca granosa]|uniref:DUF19 domain-containing protein n=1 Tax=Tegillarca granosa TaxID=220873 RepID=A0ABQ9EAQ0_TEGGR|nr:hypothetical protein KUTeg_021242 [Tegillarca granosa]